VSGGQTAAAQKQADPPAKPAARQATVTLLKDPDAAPGLKATVLPPVEPKKPKVAIIGTTDEVDAEIRAKMRGRATVAGKP
jgi:hypothetical protein